ncbi:MAG: HEPN domain-containing protein [Anaerolineales bacterium]
MENTTGNNVEAIIEKELSDVYRVIKVMNQNTKRILRLLKESIKLSELSDNKIQFADYMNDVVRAAVVFLHSLLETTLREIVRIKIINDPALIQTNLSGQLTFPNRKEKISLSELIQYREKLIGDIVDESVNAYLVNLSFNSSNDIADIFKKIKLDQSSLKQYYPVLDEITQRRHQIVHEADFVRWQDPPVLQKIDPKKIKPWIDSTHEFCVQALKLLVDSVYLDKIVDRLAENGIQVDKLQVSKWISINVEEK